MKKTHFFPALVSSVLFLAAGCVGQAYDPTTNAVSSGDKIEIADLSAKPEKVVVPQTFQATMLVKNLSKKTLTDVQYIFDLGSDSVKIGTGKIPSIKPGETIEVKSDNAKLPQGIYRIQGKVFLSKGQEESKFEDRMNNVKAVQVMVTN